MSEKENFIANLRAIIISCKGGLPLSNVQSDYAEAFGEKPPFKALGYKSLKHFLEENKADFQISGEKVHAVVNSASSHISSLVQRQKRGKVKRARSMNKAISLGKKTHPTVGGGIQSNGNKKSVKEHGIAQVIKVPKASKDQSKSLVNVSKTVSFEKITLRKPHGSKPLNHNSDQVRPSTLTLSTQDKSPPSTENLTPVTSESNESFSSKSSSKEILNNPIIIPVADVFGNVMDYPATSVQARVLKQKFKSTQNQECPDPANKSIAGGSMDKTALFELSLNLWNHDSSISSLPSPSSVQSPNSPSPIQDIPPTIGGRQKAQARIANIKISMQKNISDQEVNNNSVDGNVTTPLSSAKAINCAEMNENQVFTSNQSNNIKTQIYPTDTCISTDGDAERGFVKKLMELCKLRNIPEPYYKIIMREPKNEPKQYICKVQLDEHLQLSSYPIETRDPYAAKEIAAKKMYDYLFSDESYCQVSKVGESEMTARVLDIVTPTYGIWSDKLPALYKEKYNEVINKNWLNIIKKASQFEIDSFGGNRFIIRKKPEVTVPSSETTESHNESECVSQKLAELKLPESDYWELYITNIRNSDEIWCRLIGENYSDTYDAMMTKLELEPPERKVKKPKIGGIYGIKICAIWYRVRLIDIVSDDQALAFYIDVGDKETVSFIELYEPEDIYFSVAPQAILLSLHELESFSGDEELTSLITKNLLGNTYVAEIISLPRGVGNNELSRATVRLWDTSTERDININQLLLNNIIKAITLPSLPSTAKIEEVFVSSVNENGDIYIQTNKKSVDHLNCLIFNKTKSLEDDKLMLRKANYTIGTYTIHLTKHKKKDVFCRTKVIEIISSSIVDVQFIDYGCVERIPVSDLIHLERSSILQAIPAQALKVKLANVTNFNETIISKLRDIVLDQSVLMKVISSDRGAVPSVEFFKRSTPDNTLFSVNVKLNNDPQLKIAGMALSRNESLYKIQLNPVLSHYLTNPILTNDSHRSVKIRHLVSHPGRLQAVLVSGTRYAPHFVRLEGIAFLYSQLSPPNELNEMPDKMVSDINVSESPSRRKSIVVGMERVLPKNLPPPDLPSVGQHFPVFVTFASSPDLFIVQPLESRMALMDMMNELQVLYSAVDFSTTLKSYEFAVGELYAVQHPDGNWYRGCAQFVVGSDNYSVYLCDFGDCIMVTKEKLKPLPEKYKTFPYQAIRATLLGIPPEQRDWTPVDCIAFHHLVVEKYFVSTVIEINRDDRNPNFVNLGLILTDTSSDDDVFIHKVLMENKNEAFTFIKSLNITQE